MTNNASRDKRAYIAYLSELLHKQKENEWAIMEDGTNISEEIYRVEQTINDIDTVLKFYPNEAIH